MKNEVIKEQIEVVWQNKIVTRLDSLFIANLD